jgi:hypothetical protein
MRPRSHTLLKPCYDLRSRPRLAAVLGVRIADLKTAGEFPFPFQSPTGGGVEPRQVATLGLEHQFVIHLMSPCNVAGDIMSVRTILISRRPKSSFLWHSGPDSGVLHF